MNDFPRIAVCALTCAIALATPRVGAAQATPSKPAPKPAASAPAKPTAVATAAKPQAPTPAPTKPTTVTPAKPQARTATAAKPPVAPSAPAKPPVASPVPAKPLTAAPAKPATPAPIAPAKPVSAPPAAPAATNPQATAAPKTAPSAAAGPDADLAPAGYTYDPAGRRDPFVSLLTRAGVSGQRGGLGTRPTGLGGLETGEVTLRGTLLSQGAYVGIVQGSDNKTYIVKSGDRLLDGEIRSITPDTMVIMQQVTDPLSLEKQREVRKLLRPTEEAK